MGEEALAANHKRIFHKYIDKYFGTWDNLQCCMNGDYGFAPVAFCLYAETKGINPSMPIKVMRKVLDEFSKENQIT